MTVATERGFRQDRYPGSAFACLLAPGKRGGDVDRVDGAMGRVVAREEARVDVDAEDAPTHPQLEDAPVVPGRAAASRLPPIHPLAAGRELARDEDRRFRF